MQQGQQGNEQSGQRSSTAGVAVPSTYVVPASKYGVRRPDHAELAELAAREAALEKVSAWRGIASDTAVQV